MKTLENEGVVYEDETEDPAEMPIPESAEKPAPKKETPKIGEKETPAPAPAAMAKPKMALS